MRSFSQNRHDIHGKHLTSRYKFNKREGESKKCCRIPLMFAPLKTCVLLWITTEHRPNGLLCRNFSSPEGGKEKPFCKLMSSFWSNYHTFICIFEKYSAIWLLLYLPLRRERRRVTSGWISGCIIFFLRWSSKGAAISIRDNGFCGQIELGVSEVLIEPADGV